MSLDSKQESNSAQTHLLSEKYAPQALFKAIRSNDLTKVQELVESKIVDINTSLLQSGRPALWIAASSKDPAIFKYLLSKNADQKKRRGYIRSTLSQEIALYSPWEPKKKNEILASLNKKDVPPLEPHLQAAALGDLEELKKYKKEIMIKKDDKGRTVLHYAAANGQLKIVQWLFHEKIYDAADRGGNNTAALLLAAKNGHLGTVQWLLKEGGAKMNDNNDATNYYGFKSALPLAARKGHLETVKWLSKEGGAKFFSLNSTLLWAVIYNRLEIVKWLLKEGGANIRTEDGMALLRAVYEGHDELAQFMISECGANPYARNVMGETLTSILFNDTNHQSTMFMGYTKISPDSILRNPQAVEDLYQSYFVKQKVEMINATVENTLPEFIGIPDLRKMISEYHGIDPKESHILRDEIQASADRLIAPLKKHAKAWSWIGLGPKHQDLSRKLFDQISIQNPCNELTIHRAVQVFLKANGEKIKDSELAGILNGIVEQTSYFNEPVKPGIPAVEIIESKGNAQSQQSASLSQRSSSNSSKIVGQKPVADFARIISAPSSRPQEKIVPGLKASSVTTKSSMG